MEAYKQLEFDKVQGIIYDNCQSSLGQNLVGELRLLTDRLRIEYQLNISCELRDYVRLYPPPDLRGSVDITCILTENKHLVYSFEEIRDICIIARNSKHIRALKNDYLADDYPLIARFVNKLIDVGQLAVRYQNTFSPEGEVLDSASSELRRLRRKRSGLRQEIISTLQTDFNGKHADSIYQEKIVTQRDNRFVVPIKDKSAAGFNGIMHGRSTSKSTVYVEPAHIVSMNNGLAQVDAEEKEEIYRIFKKFTIEIRACEAALLNNFELVGKFDFYLAKARFAVDFVANKPVIIDEPYINIMGGRHPLLIKKIGYQAVIPFNLRLGHDYKMLVISGPNTGGKTVTLKSIGLFTLMALSGVPIPADSSTEIGMFNQVFADIGDNQSLEDSLSTFAANIERIKDMIDHGDDKSLVLVDEIGSATDPEQGSALAQAVMEDLVAKEMTGVLTTHYTALKIFAENHVSCQNAAMQFDPEKHLPTYHFKLGMPGNSFAIEVASRLGLSPALITRANSLAGDTNIELTDLLKKMSEQKKETARLNYQLELKTRLLAQRTAEYDTNIQKQADELVKIKKKALQDARMYLTDLQKKLNNDIDEIKKSDKAKRRQKIQATLNKVVDLGQSVATQSQELETSKGQALTKPQIGQEVWVKDFEDIGTIVEIKKDSIKVNMNGFYYSTSADNLYTTQKKKKTSVQPTGAGQVRTGQARVELKLLGLTFDEARPMIDIFLDEAAGANINKVRIVHGKGTGILRTKVRNYLKKCKLVHEWYSPAPEAGGDGVTVVSFS